MPQVKVPKYVERINNSAIMMGKYLAGVHSKFENYLRNPVKISWHLDVTFLLIGSANRVNMTTTRYPIITALFAFVFVIHPTKVYSRNLFSRHDTKSSSEPNPIGEDEAYVHNLNHNPFLDPNHPILPPTELTLSTGLFHTCAITHRNGVEPDSCGGGGIGCGPVKCWGNNDSGQSTPPPGVMFTQVSCGGPFTCGLKVGGKAVCWGDIDHPPRSLELVEASMASEDLQEFRHARRLQQLSDGKKKWNAIADVAGGGYYIQVSSGMKHACAISRELEVSCWGRNDYGESSPPSGMFVQVRASFGKNCIHHHHE